MQRIGLRGATPFGVPAILVLFFMSMDGQALDERSRAEPEDVGIEEKLGERIPLEATFRDHNGDTVKIGEYLEAGKPLVLSLIYHRCPMLCNLILDGKTEAIRDAGWLPGNEYHAITLSFSDLETPEIAAAARDRYLAALDMRGADAGWHFLVGDKENIHLVTDAVGYYFQWDEPSQDYAHGAAIIFIGPDGTISRYLYGIQYRARDFRNALGEASEGRIGSTVDRLILYCFQYDPDARSYVLHARNVMKLGGLLTMLILGGVLLFLWRRDRKSSRDGLLESVES